MTPVEEALQNILAPVYANMEFAPFVICGLLLLAGLGVPVSEDVMLFVSALLAAKHPEHLWPLFAGVLAGAYGSDLVCYSVLGRWLGRKMFRLRFFARLAPQERLEKIGRFYQKHGALTLLLGRFIPFGVRNALFLSAGLGKMNPAAFALWDLLACLLSCSTFFALYFHLGEPAVALVREGNRILIALLALALIGWAVRKKLAKAKPPGQSGRKLV